MNMSEKDYKNIYLLQDKFLNWWKDQNLPFYLTGGTALGRFYLKHRFSEDLDFFANEDPEFKRHIEFIRNSLNSGFSLKSEVTVFTNDFCRFFITEGEISLKIEFVNDVSARVGIPVRYQYGLLDTPLNILSNKITAILGRDEPKDIFDLVSLSHNFSFTWEAVFQIAKAKALINEIDFSQRIRSFPVNLLASANWLMQPIQEEKFERYLKQIAGEVILGGENSLGSGKPPISLVK
ncbi:MAG: hypothetical protein FMNOHCHN_01087 [Ignavibacteriaceae bacterium]|nr:hypothetical protein [Ignavibacteriaceae bacterium]